MELFQKYPDFVDISLKVNSESWMREHYGFLFAEHPKDAKELVDWGKFQLGEDDKRSPDELRDLLGWPGRKAQLLLTELPENNVSALFAEDKTDSGFMVPQIVPDIDLYDLIDRANDGSISHCLMLALGFEHGLWFGYSDNQESYYWYQEAAQRGVAEAQLKVAMLRLKGIGCDQNAEEAELWLKLAIDSGSKEISDCCELLKKIETS